MGAITLNTAKITYRSPPISSGISLMAFCHLFCRVDMPGMKVSCDDPVARRKGSGETGASSVMCCSSFALHPRNEGTA